MSKKGSFYEIKDLELDKYHISLNEVLFHNANGYIGIRYDFEEGCPEEYKLVRSQYINGFYDLTPMKQAENLYGLVQEKQTMLNIADTQSIKLFVDGEPFSMFSGTVLASRLRLDMERGVTVRQVLWRSPAGRELKLTVTRMTSFYQLPLFTIEYEILPLNFSGPVLISSTHEGNVFNYADPDDPRMPGERIRYLQPLSCEIREGASFMTSVTSKSGLEICSAVKNVLEQEHRQEISVHEQQATCLFTSQAVAGQKIRLIKYAVFCDSLRYPDCKKQAELELERALSVSLGYLYQKQKAYLKAYWQNCLVEIEGEEEDNTAIRYSLYQLLQSVSKDSCGNIAPKGLSGDGYEGQFFWDSEMYIQPFFTITNPQLSRNLIENRYATLDMARENARILGHSRGALYPWRTIMGKECSGYFPAGSAQYHINGDIAYAVIAYYLATKDLPFLLEKGAEIILETARLWLETGNFYQGKFHINGVTGPDEYTCLVNNNYYTNAIAQYHLRWAVKIYHLLRDQAPFRKLMEKIGLQEEEIAAFQEAADHMVLPYDEELKINPQDDSFLQKKKWDLKSIPKDKFPLLLHYHPLHLYRHQICKQADTVMAHFILEDAQSEETIRNSFHFYEKITTHCSSLSYCIFSIMAARLGMTAKAFAYYNHSAKLDLEDKHRNTADGIHTANMGGSYMAIVYGFGGFRLKESGISLAPVLPGKWKSYSFIISFEGSRLKVMVDREGCRISLEKGKAKKITVYGKEYLLTDTLRIERPDFSAEREKYPKYQAIIFDLDGVICSTDHCHYAAWKEIAEELQLEFNEEINHRLRGIGRLESLDLILGPRRDEFSEEAKREYAEKKNRIYRRLIAQLTPADLDPEIKKTMDEIKAKGIKIAIGSSSKNTPLILQRLGLDHYFDAVADGNQISRSKPDPEVFLKASEYLGIPPAFCLVVEDAKAGLEAAIAAQMDCAAIGEGTRYNMATYNLSKFSDLLRYI